MEFNEVYTTVIHIENRPLCLSRWSHNLYHIGTVLSLNFVQIILVQHVHYAGTTCKFCVIYNFCTIGVYDSLYCAFRPMKYVESDVLWYNVTYDINTCTLS